MSKNAEKTFKNVKKPGKNRQKYRKIVKNVEKPVKDCQKVE